MKSWLVNFVRQTGSGPFHAAVQQNVDWQHRVNVLESKVTELEAEVEAKDKKIAAFLKEFEPLRDRDAEIVQLTDETERLQSAKRCLQEICRKKDDEISMLRKQIDILYSEESRIKEVLMSIANLAVTEVEKDEAPESVDDSES